MLRPMVGGARVVGHGRVSGRVTVQATGRAMGRAMGRAIGRHDVDLRTLITGLPGLREVPPGASSVRICDLTEDSRTSVPGSLFIARVGERWDGRACVGEAVGCGAVAVLAEDLGGVSVPEGCVAVLVEDVSRATAWLSERFYGSPSSSLRVVGVTGTNGKSTVAHLVHGMLNGVGVRCGLIGTISTDDGVEHVPSSMTTPPALELRRTLAVMVEAGCRAGAMEVSSHALVQRRADDLRFAAGVFTNITPEHLDYHGTMEAYVAAKRRLFELLGPEGLAVVNGRDPRSTEMLAGRGSAGSTAVVVCGGVPVFDPPAESSVWSGAVERAGLTGMSVRVEVSGGASGLARAGFGDRVVMEGVEVPLIGLHNVSNLVQAMAAVASVLRGEGHEGADLAAALREASSHASAPCGRLERISEAGDPVHVLVDYAHTDDALASMLSAVRSAAPSGSLLSVVFGCGGDRDRGKRPRMGEVACRLADRVTLTSDNPRSESPSAIVDEILSGVPRSARGGVAVHVDRERAIRSAIAGAWHEALSRGGSPAIVVIAGKGHEREQIVASGGGWSVGSGVTRGALVSRPFSDHEVGRRVLAELRRSTGVPSTGVVGSEAGG